MAVLFLLMAAGFIIGKAKLLTVEGNKLFSKFIIYVALPCTILSSVVENEADITAFDTVYFLLMTLLTFAIAFAIALPVVYLLGKKKTDRGLLSFMSVFSNCGFMGFPITIAVLGVSSAFYVALFNIPFTILLFSVGIVMISGKREKFDLKRFINPTLVAAFIAIPIALADISFPYVIRETLKITGATTAPIAMIVVGSALAYVPLKSVFSDWRILPVTFLKLIAVPFITWLILRQIITNELMLGVLVVISAMPTGAMSPMLAIEYGGNEHLASIGIFLTTLLCGVTVPMLVYFLLL